MTQTLSRPIMRVPHSSRGPRLPLPMAAAAAALWAVGVGLVCCVAVSVGAWFAADTGTFGGSIRVGALAWLVTLGAGLHLEGVTITVIPLGLTAITAWLLYRGGRWAGARSGMRSPRDAAMGVLALVGVFAAVVVAVQSTTASPGVFVGLWRSLAASVILAGGFGGLGLLRGAGLAAQLVAPLPAVARGALAGGCAGVAALVAASAALFTAAVVTHFSDALTVAEGMRLGAVGAAIVAVVGLAGVPNAVLCAGSFIVGSGFSVGAGTSVAPGGITLGALPAFPLFAALPSGDGAWWQQGLLAVPLAAGAVAGLVTARRCPPSDDGWRGCAVPGACGGLLTGLGFGALMWLATGAIGPGRMQEVGPHVVMTTVVATVAAVLGGAAAPIAKRWLSRR